MNGHMIANPDIPQTVASYSYSQSVLLKPGSYIEKKWTV